MNLFILGFPVTSLCLTRHLLHSILFSHNGYCLFFYISWGSETVFWNYLWWSFDPLVMHFFHYLCYLFFIFIHPGMKINLLRPSVCEHIACTVCSSPVQYVLAIGSLICSWRAKWHVLGQIQLLTGRRLMQRCALRWAPLLPTTSPPPLPALLTREHTKAHHLQIPFFQDSLFVPVAFSDWTCVPGFSMLRLNLITSNFIVLHWEFYTNKDGITPWVEDSFIQQRDS